MPHKTKLSETEELEIGEEQSSNKLMLSEKDFVKLSEAFKRRWVEFPKSEDDLGLQVSAMMPFKNKMRKLGISSPPITPKQELPDDKDKLIELLNEIQEDYAKEIAGEKENYDEQMMKMRKDHEKNLIMLAAELHDKEKEIKSKLLFLYPSTKTEELIVTEEDNTLWIEKK